MAWWNLSFVPGNIKKPSFLFCHHSFYSFEIEVNQFFSLHFKFHLFLSSKITKIWPTMILKTCLEITTFRCVFMYSVLFCPSSSSCSVFSALARNIGYSLESSIFSKQKKVFLHVCPSPSSTQLYLCPMRFCSHFVHFGGLIRCIPSPS